MKSGKYELVCNLHTFPCIRFLYGYWIAAWPFCTNNTKTWLVYLWFHYFSDSTCFKTLQCNIIQFIKLIKKLPKRSFQVSRVEKIKNKWQQERWKGRVLAYGLLWETRLLFWLLRAVNCIMTRTTEGRQWGVQCFSTSCKRGRHLSVTTTSKHQRKDEGIIAKWDKLLREIQHHEDQLLTDCTDFKHLG